MYNFEKAVVNQREPNSSYWDNWLKLFLKENRFKNEMDFLGITVNYQNSSGVKFIFWENGIWRETYFISSKLTKTQVTIPGDIL